MPTYIRVKQIDPDELSSYFNESIVSNSGVLYGYIASEAISLTGNQTISGFKTFSSGTTFEKYIELNNLGDHANLSGLLVQVSGSGLRFFNKTGQKFFVDQIAGSGTGLNTLQLSNTNTTLKIPNNKNGYLAIDSELVHNTGQEIISGQKTFKNALYLSDLNINDIDSLYISGVDIELYDLNLSLDGTSLSTNIPNQILNTTYSELTGLKATSSLLSGQLYRISDFILKWNNQSINDQTVKSGTVIEPLIVTALSKDKIYHIAQSETYPQDTIYYNIDASGSYSWGSINNNASIPNFKGWIYRRIDNLLNIDIPYDWRNITVNCCKPDVSSVPNYSGNYSYNRLAYVKETGNNTNRGKIYYSLVTGNSGKALSDINFWSPVSAFTESGTFFATDESYGFKALYIGDEGDAIINLPALTVSRIQQPTFTSILTGLGTFTLSDVRNIEVEGGHSNVMVGISNFLGNILGAYGNKIGNNFYFNTMDRNFFNNTIGNNFIGNTVGYSFYKNIINDDFSYNNIGDNFSNSDIGSNFYFNTVGSQFYHNHVERLASTNNFGYGFSYNYIKSFFSANNIGNYAGSNNIGVFFQENTIGSSFVHNSLSDTDSFSSNTIGNNFRNNISEGLCSSINFLTSTHVYNSYNKTLFLNSAGTLRLRYFNSNDQLVVTDPTA